MKNAFSRFVDALPGMVWTALPDGTIDLVNRRWCEYIQTEMRGFPLLGPAPIQRGQTRRWIEPANQGSWRRTLFRPRTYNPLHRSRTVKKTPSRVPETEKPQTSTLKPTRVSCVLRGTSGTKALLNLGNKHLAVFRLNAKEKCQRCVARKNNEASQNQLKPVFAGQNSHMQSIR